MKYSLSVSLLFIVTSFFAVDIILNYLGRDYLFENINVFYILLLNVFIGAVSLVPHYFLLGLEQDKYISIASFTSLFIFAILIVLFYQKFGTIGISFAVMMTTISSLTLKIIFSYKSFKNEWL